MSIIKAGVSVGGKPQPTTVARASRKKTSGIASKSKPNTLPIQPVTVSSAPSRRDLLGNSLESLAVALAKLANSAGGTTPPKGDKEKFNRSDLFNGIRDCLKSIKNQ